MFGLPLSFGVGNGLSSSCNSSSTTLGVICVYKALPPLLFADDMSESLVFVKPIKSREVSEPVTDVPDGGRA